ncbi:MAG: EF-hand domain-containing protein [Paracoccaceae bacterium]|jgi:opacity protein-like surface antigen
MKLFALALAPVLLAFPAFAADLPMVEDADASGAYSLAELQTVWKDLTEDNFMAIDTNADGSVDATELQTAWDNGVLKPVEG